MGRSPVPASDNALSKNPFAGNSSGKKARGALAWVMTGMTLLLGSLYASSDRLAALVPPDNLYADALWIGEIDRVTRYRLDAGAVWLSLSQAARALAIDPAGVLWVYGEELSTYNFQGELQGTVSPGPDNSSKALLTVNANTGDAWFGLGTRLQRFRADRTLATTLTLPSKVIQLAYDAASDQLWVATGSSVSVRDTNGAVMMQLPLDPANPVRSLALGGTGQAWVNDGQTLSLYSSLGQLIRRLPWPNADQVVAGPPDGLWITAGRNLVLLDALTGVERRSLDPFAQGSTIDLLAANPVDGSAFVTLGKQIVQIAPSGDAVRTLTQPEGESPGSLRRPHRAEAELHRARARQHHPQQSSPTAFRVHRRGHWGRYGQLAVIRQ